MQLRELSSTLLYAVPLLLASLKHAQAGPLSRLADALNLQHQDPAQYENGTLVARSDCANPCGYYNQLCCPAGQSCGTNSLGQAQCGAAAAAAVATTGAGSWQTVTSTWVETNQVTKTSTYSTWVPASAATCTPNYAANEAGCGPKCCQSGYYCIDDKIGQCASAGNGGYTTTGVGGAVPGRPTTISGVIVTMTVKPTTTLPYQTAIPTGVNGTIIAAHSPKLSGGAIAGIVIGVIAGIILLLLICFCCCLRAGFDGLLAILGLGGRKKRRDHRTTVIEEEVIRHHRHGSADGRRWPGSAASARPSRASRPPPPKRTNRWGGLGALAAGLGTALAIGKLGKSKQSRKSDVSSGYYSDSGYMYSGKS
jgi:hypothetical protein